MLLPNKLTKFLFNSELNLYHMIRVFFLLLVICGFTSYLIAPYWSRHIILFHTILESICIVVTLSCFLLIWSNYARIPFNLRFLGFFFLTVACLDFLHILAFPGTGYTLNGYIDLGTRFWVAGRIVEALMLLLIVCNLMNFKTSRFKSFLITISSTAFIILLVAFLAHTRPPLFVLHQGVSSTKIMWESIIIFIYLVIMVKIYKYPNDKTPFSYYYIFFGLPFAIYAEICLIMYIDLSSFFMLLGHLFKLVFYYYLYKGVFEALVAYPYKKMSDTFKQTKAILNNLPLCVIMWDKQARVSFANTKALELLKAPEEVILNSTSYDLANRLYFNPHNKPSINGVNEHILTINNQIKEIYDWTGNKLKITVNIININEGGYICIFREAKQEQELNNLELQTQAILDSVHSLVVILDGNQSITNANLAFIRTTELDLADIMGKTVTNLITLLQFKNTGLKYDRDCLPIFEGTIRTYQSHKLKHILYDITPVHNIDNEVVGQVICSLDITSFKEEQQKLLQKEKLATIGQMAAGIVHEIKNPLTTIKGFIQIISSARLEQGELKEYLSLIEESSNEVNRVVMDFLAFSKPRSIQLRPNSLSQIIESMLPLIESHLFINGVTLICQLTPQERKVNVDEEQLKQVILNMVKNSVEALDNKKDAIVTISTNLVQEDKFMVIAISDNGNGIDEKFKNHLGQPFYTTKENGTGLGLSICFSIIEEHRGYIELESNLGQGTTFFIYLPVIN